MVATSPWGDVFDEFTPRSVPYGYNDDEQKDAERRKKKNKGLSDLNFPDEDGAQLGRNRIAVTPTMLESRVERWNSYYNAKQRVIEVDLLDLRRRKAGPGYNLMAALTAVFSFIVFLAVLAVDYAVLSEFWAGIYSDEFGEVPPDFAASVIVKSLQVVVAALAFHFFFQNLSREHRKGFTFFVFSVTLLFLLGLGVINGANSLPEPDSQRFDTSQEDAQILESLGLTGGEDVEPTAEELQAQAEERQRIRDEQESYAQAQRIGNAVWLPTLGLLFIAVTSVAALVLHVALRSVEGIFGRIDNEHRFTNRSIVNRRDMQFRELRAKRALDWLNSEDVRRDLLRQCVSAFETGYLYGLFGNDPNARREPNAEQQSLVGSLETAVAGVNGPGGILGEGSPRSFVAHVDKPIEDYDIEDDKKKKKKDGDDGSDGADVAQETSQTGSSTG